MAPREGTRNCIRVIVYVIDITSVGVSVPNGTILVGNAMSNIVTVLIIFTCSRNVLCAEITHDYKVTQTSAVTTAATESLVISFVPERMHDGIAHSASLVEIGNKRCITAILSVTGADTGLEVGVSLVGFTYGLHLSLCPVVRQRDVLHVGIVELEVRRIDMVHLYGLHVQSIQRGNVFGAEFQCGVARIEGTEVQILEIHTYLRKSSSQLSRILNPDGGNRLSLIRAVILHPCGCRDSRCCPRPYRDAKHCEKQ